MWIFKYVNVSLQFQSRKLVHKPGIHCHMCASSTGGCAFMNFTLQYCIYTVLQHLYFKPRVSGSKYKSSSDVAGASSVAQLHQVLSRVWLFATLWTVARQAPLSMGLSRQEHWSGLPSSSRGSSQPRNRTLSSWDVAHAIVVFKELCCVCMLSHVQLFVTPWTIAS